MSGIERAPTGIDGFDKVSHGGLPRGRTSVITGAPGAGKSIFCMQFLVEGVRRFGEPGVYVTFEEHPEDLIENTRGFDWDLEGLVESGQIVLVDASGIEDEIQMSGFELDGLLARIEHAIERSGAKRVVIDSVSAVLDRFGARGDARTWLLALARGIRATGVTPLLALERRQQEEAWRETAVESVVADAVVVLRNRLSGSVRRRSIEGAKLRGGSHERGVFPSAIRADTGFGVIPLAATALTRPAVTQRSTLGHPELDRMTGGGVFRDTITLVGGASGTGKSSIASMFLAGGYAVGDRGLLFSFEESPEEYIRNSRSIGVDLEAGLDAGGLRIIARYPERLPLEDLLAQMRADIEEHQPDRIVLDSLSALGRTVEPGELRDFIVGLTTYLKERTTAGLLTELAEHRVDGSLRESFASSLSDAIVMLRFHERDNRVDRSLTVVKIRGSAHDSSIRGYAITGRGLEFPEDA